MNIDRRQLSLSQVKEIREKLKPTVKELKRQGKTQKEIAEITGVPRTTIETWLNNNITNDEFVNSYIAPDCRVKLPKNAKQEILNRCRKGETQKQIAADYQITQPRVSNIVNLLLLTHYSRIDFCLNLAATVKLMTD